MMRRPEQEALSTVDERTARGERGSQEWESDLVRRGRAGDRDAFGELLRFYESRVYTLVRRYVGRPAEAAELTQEVFLQAFRSSQRFEEGKPFRPWLYKIAVNVCRNYRRLGSRREHPSELEDGVDGLWQAEVARPEAAILEEADRDQVATLLAALAPDERTLLQLRYREEMSYADLARVFGRPEALLKMRVHRALKKMRALVEGERR